MSDESTFADLFYVGHIYVDVGYEWVSGPFMFGGRPLDLGHDWPSSGPMARTATPTLFATDLGGEIRVELSGYDDEELEKALPPWGSVEMWKRLIVEMRDMLARCMVLGEMLICQDMLKPGDHEKVLEQAVIELQEAGALEITLTHAIEALRARARHEASFRDGLKGLLEYVEAQQEHPDEDITIGEAVGRHYKGTEEVRKIVEGDEREEEEG